MSKFLIFRTDRIGDYIFSRILTESIKKDNPKNTIDFVCSSYNSQYVKNYNDVKIGDQIECYERIEIARTID